MTRREFLKKTVYLLLSIPLFAFISKIKKIKEPTAKRTTHEAMYYNKLAG